MLSMGHPVICHPMRLPARQRGVFLLEALIGILIFSVGILALVAMQAAAISAQTDAQYRIEAANRAEQMANEIALNVDRTSNATIQTSLATFAHHPTGANCSFTGADSSNPLVLAWIAVITTGATKLPGTSTNLTQIAIDTTSTAYNKVTVTLCWQTPNDPIARRHSVVSFIN